MLELDDLGAADTYQQQTEIIDPQTGEAVDLGCIDDLLAAYQRFVEHEAERQVFKARLVTAIAALTTGDKKTRRLRGSRLRARVEMPDDAWDSSVLKECWNSYEPLARKYLRIGSIYPQFREVAKLANETGGPDFMQFRQMVLGANRGPRGLPRIVIESEDQPPPAGGDDIGF